MGKKNTLDLDKTTDWLDIFYILKELYITTFKWNNLPESVNARYLELCLFEFDGVAFFRDKILGELALQCSTSGNLNVYREPTKVMAIGSNYHKQLINHKDTVIIYNNFMRMSPQRRIESYAKRIYNAEKTIDLNIFAQRTPILLKCSKEQEQTLKNIYRNYETYEPVIIIDDKFDTSKLNAVKTDAPFVADKIEEEKRKLWNEALSFIGIENNFSEKNERLTSNEVLISNSLTNASKNSRLQAREIAVAEINKLFNLNISVEVNNISVLDLIAEEKKTGIGVDNLG